MRGKIVREGVPNTDVTRSIPFLPQPMKSNRHRNGEEGESEKTNNFGNTWTFNTSNFWKSESSQTLKREIN